MSAERTRRPTVYALSLIIFAVIGWWAAFSLTRERFELSENPDTTLSCDFSLLVQCTKNLEAWQGSVFGFPNPILGITGWIAPIVVGFALLAGAQFARWFRLLFWLGIAGAQTFIIWLISQSIFELGTLCPWCMVTWAVTIPTFWMVTMRSLSDGTFSSSPRVTSLGAKLSSWLPVFIVASYLLVAVIAQLRLDVIGNLMMTL